MLTEEKTLELLWKYRTHRLVKSEFEELRRWIDESPVHKDFFIKYLRLYKTELQYETFTHVRPDKAWEVLERRWQTHRWRQRFLYGSAAAVLLLLLGVGILLHSSPSEEPPVESLVSLFPTYPQNEVTLTLAGGEVIPLHADTLQVTATGATQTLRHGSWQTLVVERGKEPATEAYHRIAVGEGSTFCLTLADGSRVWLNANAQFSYQPDMSERRVVRLDGEAYFEISHGGTPFVVETSQGTITVHGTSFNLAASHQGQLTATLAEGAITLTCPWGTQDLKPGQQATVVAERGTIEVCTVDAALYTSWHSGRFEFHDTPLRTLLRQLELWYGVKFTYPEEALSAIRFDGVLLRNRPLGFTLEIIQQISDVRFAKQGEHIRVYHY